MSSSRLKRFPLSMIYDNIPSSIVGPAFLVVETTQFHPWLTAAGLLFCLWFLKNIGERKLNPNRLPHPPGPKGLPFLGALFEVPSLSQKPWLVYDKWFKTYGQPCANICCTWLIYVLGDIIYFEVLGQPFMILGSLKRTNDIFDKRSSNYSDRKLSSMLELYVSFPTLNIWF